MALLDGIDRLHQALDYHLQRQNLLVANLSHVDTPGYKPLDLERGASFHGQLQQALATTEAGHMGGAESGSHFKVVEDPGASPGLDGNGVSVDREAVKIAANHVRYEALAGLVQGSLSSLEWAANDGKG
ncbi:MAG TPA: flagellar basal body rod protein FlgB [Polyangiaceae bacterium]